MSKSVAILLLLFALAGAEDQSKVNPNQNKEDSTVSKVVNTPKKADPALSEAVPVPKTVDPSPSEAMPTPQKLTPSPTKPVATLNDAVPPPIAAEDDLNAQGKTRKASLPPIQNQIQDNTSGEKKKPADQAGTSTSIGDGHKQNDNGGNQNVTPTAQEDHAPLSQEKEKKADQDIKNFGEIENIDAGDNDADKGAEDKPIDNNAGDTTTPTNSGAGDTTTPTNSGAGDTTPTNSGAGDTTPTNSGTGNSAGDTTPTNSGTGNQKDQETNPEKTEINDQKKPETKILKKEFVYTSSEETKTLKRTINDETGKKGEVWDISLKCRDCLCYFATDCDMERGCETPRSIFGLGEGFEKGDCGPFHISFPFWCDAHNIQMDIGDAKMENDWRLCSLDLLCTTETIQKYFHKYPRDCNGDGKVDCLDYAAIHTLGPYGCLDKVKLNYWNRVRRKSMLQCMVSEETGPYAKKMLELQEKLKVQDFAAWKLEEIEKRKNSASVESTTDNPKSDKEGEKTVNHENPVENTDSIKTNPEKFVANLWSSAPDPGSAVKSPEEDVENHGNAAGNSEESKESDSSENNSPGDKDIIQT